MALGSLASLTWRRDYCDARAVALSWDCQSNGYTVRELSVPKDRSGKVKIGLLLWLIVLAVVGYYGIEFGGVYWRRYKLEEAVKQRLGYAGQLTSEGIRQHLLDDIASMDLPPAARNVKFVETRQPRALHVSISYAETVNLLFTTKKFPVSIEIRRSF